LGWIVGANQRDFHGKLEIMHEPTC